jgi:hypothetical protein
MAISNDESKKRFGLAQIIFVALMAAFNMVFDTVVSPGIIAIFTHIITGIFIMVPINFLFMSITKRMVDKFGTLTLYLAIFATLAIPTSMFGGVAGAYKIIVGVAIGLLLDLAFLPKKPIIKLLTGGILGAIFWWVATYTVWQAFSLPFVTNFSKLMKNSSIDITAFVTLPISGFGIEFYKFAVICGILSAGPVLIACILGFVLFERIKKTASYQRFLATN